jgi:hypothetical protein
LSLEVLSDDERLFPPSSSFSPLSSAKQEGGCRRRWRPRRVSVPVVVVVDAHFSNSNNDYNNNNTFVAAWPFLLFVWFVLLLLPRLSHLCLCVFSVFTYDSFHSLMIFRLAQMNNRTPTTADTNDSH